MKTFTNTTFDGFHPVGTAAVVHADTPEAAAAALNEELIKKGLAGDVKPEDMVRFLPREGVRILCDGDY